MNPTHSEKPDEIQLLTDGEAKTLTLALLEGAGGCLKAEELDAAMERTFEWAQQVRFESTALKCILRGKLLVGCDPNGEIVFISKKEDLAQPLRNSAREFTNGEDTIQ